MLSNRIAQLVPPPRWVPLPVACSAMLGLVGGMGALFFLFGMVFVWIFAGDLNPINEWRLARSAAQAEATITQVKATSASENDETVYEYQFTFWTADEQHITARNYSTGQMWGQGDQVTAHYIPDKPTVARLDGARLSTFSPWALFVLIFPLVGAVMFIIATLSGLRQIILLRYGEVAGARTLSQETTGASINDQPVMKYRYEFQASDGMTYSGSSNALPTGRIGDEAQEPILYLPSNPRVSMLVDALPLRYTLDVDDNGQWTAYENMWPMVWFGLAWAGLAANVLYGLWRLLS